MLKAKTEIVVQVDVTKLVPLSENSWTMEGKIVAVMKHSYEFEHRFTAKLVLHSPGYVLRVEEFSGPPQVAMGEDFFRALLDIARESDALKLSKALVAAK